MSDEAQNNPTPTQTTPTILEKAHPAAYARLQATGDAHQGTPGAATAQALGGFPQVASAIKDPNTVSQAQVNSGDKPPKNESGSTGG